MSAKSLLFGVPVAFYELTVRLTVQTENLRTRFRRADKSVCESHQLPSGSLLWMCPEMQAEWWHAILADPCASGGRISLTFRRMKA